MVSRTYRYKKLFRSQFYRLLKWEFWPVWVVYLPVSFYIVWLAIKYRHATLFTAANPAIPMGGVMGVEKSNILRILQKGSPQNVPRFITLSKEHSLKEKRSIARKFSKKNYPVVVKPDNGQRGDSVHIIEDESALISALKNTPGDIIIQDYVGGEEFGVFVIKEPDQKAQIFSITHKARPVVAGDGRRTLEQLILDDPRANLMARFLLKKHYKDLSLVVEKGTKYSIVDLGTHSRGAVFKDANHLKTEALKQCMDGILKKSPGLYFGRFDIRVPSIDDFKQGKNLSIIEMNGVTSEPGHIYDPEASLIDAWKTLFSQWYQAFELGKKNLQKGAETATVRIIVAEHLNYRKKRYAFLNKTG